MKEVLQWHMLYDTMLKDIEMHQPPVRISRSPGPSCYRHLKCATDGFQGCSHGGYPPGPPGRRANLATGPMSRGNPDWVSARAVRARGKADCILVPCPRNRLSHRVHRGCPALGSPGYVVCLFCLSSTNQIPDSPAHSELNFQASHLAALQLISTTLVVVGLGNASIVRVAD